MSSFFPITATPLITGAPNGASLSSSPFGQDMNIALPIIIALGLLISASDAADHVVPYEAFGPQAIAHKLIGMEWWQWDSHGDSRPRKYPIKVVIYWGQSLEATKRRFPVDRSKEQDFRYVEYSAAVNHMQNAIKELEALDLNTSKIHSALDAIRVAHAKTEQVGAGNGLAPVPDL
jgi:hypothetical protein